jgi:hypothetical protein
LFIINEQNTILNMPRKAHTPAVALGPYERRLAKWLPDVHIEPTAPPYDATLRWRGKRAAQYHVEYKPNLAQQDVLAVTLQVHRYRQTRPGDRGRLLIAAPFIRREQAAVLERHDIDYVDLAGNAHLAVPGVFVHVEGLRPPPKQAHGPRRMTRGWVKTVLALLVRPELANEPYRPIADVADVAPATVMTCVRDLRAAGFIERQKGTRRLANVRELVAAWVHAYGEVLRPKLNERHFQMKMVDKAARWLQLDTVLAKHHVPWTLTGADAALLTDPHLRTDDTAVYAAPEQFEDPELLRQLQVQPATRGNLHVIEPPGPIALEPTRAERTPTAPLVLTYAELRYQNTDQANEAAELLLPEVLTHAEA